MGTQQALEAQCYLPNTPGEMLVWTLVAGGAFALLSGFGLIAFDSARRTVTVHGLEFVEHLLLHGAFYGSVYSGWMGFGRCGFNVAQVVVSIFVSSVCLLSAYRIGKARAAKESREHNHEFKALVDALNGMPPSA
jgi:hypothetical protein